MLARLMLSLLLSLVACNNGKLFDLCIPHSSVGNCEVVETCCDSDVCYFVIDDQEFPCDDGKECDAAIAEVEDFCGVE